MPKRRKAYRTRDHWNTGERSFYRWKMLSNIHKKKWNKIRQSTARKILKRLEGNNIKSKYKYSRTVNKYKFRVSEKKLKVKLTSTNLPLCMYIFGGSIG